MDMNEQKMYYAQVPYQKVDNQQDRLAQEQAQEIVQNDQH